MRRSSCMRRGGPSGLRDQRSVCDERESSLKLSQPGIDQSFASKNRKDCMRGTSRQHSSRRRRGRQHRARLPAPRQCDERDRASQSPPLQECGAVDPEFPYSWSLVTPARCKSGCVSRTLATRTQHLCKSIADAVRQIPSGLSGKRSPHAACLSAILRRGRCGVLLLYGVDRTTAYHIR